MMRTTADADTTTSANAGKALRRRGILAAAGVVVAGLLTRQTAQPVAAISGGGDQGTFVLGSNPWYKVSSPNTNTSNESYIATVLQATPNFGNYIDAGSGAQAVLFKADASPAAASAIGVLGQGAGYGTGVMGLMSGVGYPGPQQFAAIYGGAAANFSGVAGQCSGAGNGVYGSCTSGTGSGVAGYAIGGNGVYGLAAAAGTSQIVAGVFGDSTHTYGVIGRTTAAGYSGLTAITGTAGDAVLAPTRLDRVGSSDDPDDASVTIHGVDVRVIE